MTKMINRNLDQSYFRVFREGKWQNICFSDLTEDEMKEQLEDRNEEWYKNMIIHLAKTIRNIGDELDLMKRS